MGCDTTDESEILEYLSGFLTPARHEKMHRVLSERTRYLCVVVEDIYQPHNASAVLRTCDCFGIQDVHIIENRNTYRVNPGVELGTAQWLSLTYYRGGTNNTPEAIDRIRDLGYRIVATTPHTDQVSADRFDLHAGPAALLFGNEPDGLSETALEMADEHMVIPMVGFVESFNISVSAAIILHELTGRLRGSTIPYTLDAATKRAILLQWVRGSVGRSEALEKEYFRRRRES